MLTILLKMIGSYGKFPPAEEDEDDLREGEDGLNFTDPYSNGTSTTSLTIKWHY